MSRGAGCLARPLQDAAFLAPQLGARGVSDGRALSPPGPSSFSVVPTRPGCQVQTALGPGCGAVDAGALPAHSTPTPPRRAPPGVQLCTAWAVGPGRGPWPLLPAAPFAASLALALGPPWRRGPAMSPEEELV